MTTSNHGGWTDDHAAERNAMKYQKHLALVWVAEQTKANERASAEYVRMMEDEADYADHIATQEWARY